MRQDTRAPRGASAIKAIVALGLITFVGLALFSWGFKRSLAPNEIERVHILRNLSPFSQPHSQEILNRLWQANQQIGATEDLVTLLKKELANTGLPVTRRQCGERQAAGITLLSATLPGSRTGAIHLIACCFPLSDESGLFLGANAVCAPAAFLIELARAFPRNRTGRSLQLHLLIEALPAAQDPHMREFEGLNAFFAIPAIAAEGGLALAFFMPGDCFLKCFLDPQAPQWLGEELFSTAFRLGYRHHFMHTPRPLKAFQRLQAPEGFPLFVLGDPLYGGSLSTHQRCYCTREDTLEMVCAESLQAIADVLYHGLPALDGELDRQAASGG